MSFFKPKQAISPIDELKNLQEWWQAVRDIYVKSNLFTSYQTLQLEKSLLGLSEIIQNNRRDAANDRLKALNKLYTHVLNWQHMHAIKRKSSHRSEQIELLKTWIEVQIGQLCQDNNLLTPHNLADKEQRYQQSIQFSSSVELISSRSIDDQPLNVWWRKNSDLGYFKTNFSTGWFDRRSQATKELDYAIEWFSKSVILDEIDSLQNLMDAIDVWMEDRQRGSKRVPIVTMLKKRISREMEKLMPVGKEMEIEKENIDYNDDRPCDSPRPSIYYWAGKASLVLGYFLQDTMMFFDNVFAGLLFY